MSRICQFGRSIIALAKWLFYSAGIAPLVIVAGCTAQPPTDVLTRAELGARTADEARAAELAPVDYKNARDKLAKAKLAMAAGRYEEARRLAESAQVDAELAEAKAEAEIVRRAADQLWKKSEVPPTKAERESREPLTPGAEKE